MEGKSARWPSVAAGSLLVLTVGLTGCAHVSQDDLDARLDGLRGELREEMAEGDRRVQDELEGRMDGIEARMDDLERDLASMEEEFDATVQRLETALRFNMPVHFGFDEARLREQDKPVLDRFARVVKEYYPDALVTVEGFTDPAGSEEYNLRLGQRRADSVKSYLADQTELSAERIRTVSYGEATPRQVAESAHGPGREGWENRRVVLVIDHGGSGPAGATVTQEDQASEGESES